MKTMKYKGFVGTVEYSEEDGRFFGKVLENVMKGRQKKNFVRTSRKP